MINHWVRQNFAAGDIVFKEGDMGHDAYLIERGCINITINRDGEERVVASLREGEMFGEIALIDQMTRTASAIAIEATTLIPITRDLMVSKLKQSDSLLSHMLEVVVDRYRDAMDNHAPRAPELTGPRETGMHNLRDYAVNQLKMAQSLSDALERDEFLLYYQPVVYLQDGRLAGFEALIRWNQPDMGFVSPLGFIGIAEDTGLIVPIGRWVLATAITALGQFQKTMDAQHPGNAGLFMSINVSARQLQELGEVSEIAALIRDSGVDPRRIKLEITESALIDNPEMAALSLHKLKELGLLLAIDDFGTGYSSLSYLGQFPLDTLKIDQSFVATMREKNASLRITRAIAGMALDLEMNCIAEGIEHASDIEALLTMGCEFGQGYHFSKPLSEAQAQEFIKRRAVPVSGANPSG